MNFKYFGHISGKQPALGEDFYTKALPTMLVGFIIWLGAVLYYGGLLWADPYDLFSVTPTQLIVFIVAYIVVWVVLFISCLLRGNLVAMIFFFIMAGFSGFLYGFLIQYVAVYLGSESLTRSIFFTAVLSGVIATVGAVSLGLIYKDKLTKHFCIAFLVFGICFAILEGIISLVFGNTIEREIIIEFIAIAYIFGVLVFDAAVMPAQIKRGYWMMAVVDIFFDMIIMIIRIFLFLVSLKEGNRSRGYRRK